MATTATPSAQWKQTIDGALKNPKWNEYDCEIQRAVAQFNRHLTGVAGYLPLDWRMVKAMLWTESGGPTNRAWVNNPMQIGVNGDPGLRALLGVLEGGPLIIPPELKTTLTVAAAKTSPAANIRAGIAYLLMRLARYGFQTFPDNDTVYVVTSKRGDSFARIAQREGSTRATLERLNPGLPVLPPNHAVKCQKASVRKVITGWRAVTPMSIARFYNTREPVYAQKLQYCLSLIHSAPSMATACAN